MRRSESVSLATCSWPGKVLAVDGMTMRVREWMTHPVISVRPYDSAEHARGVMEKHRVNQLPVLKGPRLVGIVSDRDLRDAAPSLAESAPLSGWGPIAIPVEEVMTHDVLTVEPDSSLAEAARLLHDERIGALPVVSGGHLVGILTRSDLLEVLIGLLPEAQGRPAGAGIGRG